MIQTWEELMERTNWPLLHKQKLTLLKIMGDTILSIKERQDLDGLLNFLDNIQDMAADEYQLWTFPVTKEEE